MKAKADSFEQATIYRASVAAAPLAAWVKAQVKYSSVLERISPLENELGEATQALVSSQQALARNKAELGEIDLKVGRLKTVRRRRRRRCGGRHERRESHRACPLVAVPRAGVRFAHGRGRDAQAGAGADRGHAQARQRAPGAALGRARPVEGARRGADPRPGRPAYPGAFDLCCHRLPCRTTTSSPLPLPPRTHPSGRPSSPRASSSTSAAAPRWSARRPSRAGRAPSTTC